MILVSKEELDNIKSVVPTVKSSMTSKQKKAKRKKYWVEEDERVLNVISSLRNKNLYERH